MLKRKWPLYINVGYPNPHHMPVISIYFYLNSGFGLGRRVPYLVLNPGAFYSWIPFQIPPMTFVRTLSHLTSPAPLHNRQWMFKYNLELLTWKRLNLLFNHLLPKTFKIFQDLNHTDPSFRWLCHSYRMQPLKDNSIPFRVEFLRKCVTRLNKKNVQFRNKRYQELSSPSDADQIISKSLNNVVFLWNKLNIT